MILFAAFLAGFSALAIEVLGVHFVAPWFGASSLVWSNQIGVILFAMALGAAIGGRVAKKHSNPALASGLVLFVSGLLLAFSAFFLPLFADWFLPDALRLDEAATLFLGGSLTSALFFFAPPVFMLAMVAPLLVELRSVERGAGRAAGEISAMGTVGSLLGVFGTTFLGIPVLGVRHSLFGIAFLLVLVGLLLWRTKPSISKFTPVLILFLFWTPDLSISANLPPGNPVVEQVADTPYQRLRTLRFDDGTWWLQMNEGVDSFQSIHKPDSTWPGSYYDLFVLAPIYAMEGRDGSAPFQFWTLGHGAGSAMEPLLAGIGTQDWSAVGVELDPKVLELSPKSKWGSRLQLVAGDARSLLRYAPKNLDLVLLDAYSRQFEIPLHLATQEFFSEVYGHLSDGGVFVANLSSSTLEEPNQSWLHALLSGVRHSFEDIRLHRVPFSRNVVLFARKGRPLPELETLVRLLPSGVPVEVGAACLPSQVVEQVPEISPLRDYLNPLALWQASEWLGGGRP